MRVAIGTQIFLPYTQSWIYRQMKDAPDKVALVICNKEENLQQFPFPSIVVVADKNIFWQKISYKLRPVFKYLPYKVSRKKARVYSEALTAHHIDIMHVHFGVMAVEFMEVCERLSVPLLVTFHGFDITAAINRDPSYHKALKKLFVKMTVGIAVSEEMKVRLIQLGCPQEKLIVSYLGIPLDEFAFQDRQVHHGPVKFLHAGRFSATKGVPDLIRAFSSEFTAADNVQLLIAGDGEEKEMILESIEQSSVKDKIIFLGKLSNESLMQHRRSSDVFVLNCRTPESGDKEGLPIALLEASATGLPVITTYHSGIAEGVKHEQTGLLVNEYDQRGLASAMRRMMSKEERLKLGRQGRSYMEEQFDLSSCNEFLYDTYTKVFQAKQKTVASSKQDSFIDTPNTALFVDEFLPYTHLWIYRQIADPLINVKTVLCNRITDEKFPVSRCVASETRFTWQEYIKGRLWFLFKYVSSNLSRKTLDVFKKELKEQNIQLVHAHFGTNGVLIAPLCQALNLPLIVTFHGFDISSAPLRWPAYRKKLQTLFQQLTYAIAISDEMKQRLIALGCPPEKVRVSYLGVPLDKFPFHDRSAHEGPVVFLHAGRLTAKKGVPDLVQTFAKEFRTAGEAELWIAGTGEEQQLIEDNIVFFQPACTVRLLGKLYYDELIQAMQQADVFVINSRTDKAGATEGLPISILEACSTGMPVISTFHAGIPEAVQHGITGIMVKEYDSASLQDAMRSMLHKETRLLMGRRAHEYMQKKFSLTVCNASLQALYQSAIKK